MISAIYILVLAVVLDLLFSEPPEKIHPVVWIGKIVALAEKPGLKIKKHTTQFIYGALATLFVTALFAVPAFFLLDFLKEFNQIIYVLVAAWLLKTTFCIRVLRKTATDVRHLLSSEKIEESRSELKALVSRDPSKLGKEKIISGVVESVGESTGDSFVSPLFYFMLFGVTGAIVYRVVNTFDSMVGYRGKYEYLGKLAARLDDVLNYIPARLTALFIIIGATLRGFSSGSAFKIARRDHSKTSSPNAGWPMAAMAGALSVQLEKPEQYILGDSINKLTPETITKSVAVFGGAVAAAVLTALLIQALIIWL